MFTQALTNRPRLLFLVSTSLSRCSTHFTDFTRDASTTPCCGRFIPLVAATFEIQFARSCRRRAASSVQVFWRRGTTSVSLTVVTSLSTSCRVSSFPTRETCLFSLQTLLWYACLQRTLCDCVQLQGATQSAIRSNFPTWGNYLGLFHWKHPKFDQDGPQSVLVLQSVA